MPDIATEDCGGRIKVLWAIKGLGRGGAEVLLERIAKRIDHSKFDVSCLYVDDRFNTVRYALERSGVPVTCLGDDRRSLLWGARLFRFIRRGGFDVVHAHSPLIAAVSRIAVRLSPSAKRAKHVTTEHCMISTYHVLTRIATRITSRLDNHTIAVSRAVLDSLGDRRRCQSSLVYQGIELDMAREASKARASTCLNTAEVRLLCVANLRKQKGFRTLFGAMKYLEDWNVPFVLDIAGLGGAPESIGIERIPTQIGLSSRIRFLGSCSDIFAQMSQHDILISSSNYEAGQIVAFEAAIAGIPIVSTRVGLMTELFTDGRDCLLADVGDSRTLADNVRQLWLHPLERNRIAKNAFDLISRYDFTHAITSLEHLYQRLGTSQSGASRHRLN